MPYARFLTFLAGRSIGVGQSPPSFDKQFVGDYVEILDWDKTPPAPRLPRKIIEKTSATYCEAFQRLMNRQIETR